MIYRQIKIVFPVKLKRLWVKVLLKKTAHKPPMMENYEYFVWRLLAPLAMRILL